MAQWFGALLCSVALSAALRRGLECRFYDDHDRKVDGSTLTQVSLLRPWIRCFTMIISAWWNPASSKLKKSEAKLSRKTRKQRQLLSESRFVQSIAPPLLSRDRSIKMKQSNQIKKKKHLNRPNGKDAAVLGKQVMMFGEKRFENAVYVQSLYSHCYLCSRPSCKPFTLPSFNNLFSKV